MHKENNTNGVRGGYNNLNSGIGGFGGVEAVGTTAGMVVAVEDSLVVVREETVITVAVVAAHTTPEPIKITFQDLILVMVKSLSLFLVHSPQTKHLPFPKERPHIKSDL